MAHPAHPMPSFGSTQASTSSLTSATNSSSEMYLGYSPSASDINHVVESASKRQQSGRTRVETSVGPESSSRDLPSLAMPPSLLESSPLPIRQSRGRPSLAAIFRIPNSVPVPSSVAQPDNRVDEKGKGVTEVVDASNSNSEEDWDWIETRGGLDSIGLALGDGPATTWGRARSPYLQEGRSNLSQAKSDSKQFSNFFIPRLAEQQFAQRQHEGRSSIKRRRGDTLNYTFNIKTPTFVFQSFAHHPVESATSYVFRLFTRPRSRPTSLPVDLYGPCRRSRILSSGL